MNAMTKAPKPEDDRSPTGLVQYEAMRSAIMTVHNVDEAKSIRDKAMALEVYAKQANDMELERKVREIRIRAEDRCGALLKAQPKAKGGQPYQSGHVTGSGEPKPLDDLGITRNQSALWQKLAAVPRDEFEESLANPVGLPSAHTIVASHEKKHGTGRPEPEPIKDKDALWLWGHLLDFERRGILERDPGEVYGLMHKVMQPDVDILLPRIMDWLKGLRG